MNRKSIIGVIIVLILIIGGCWYNKEDSSSNKNLNIAVNVPMSGPISAWSGQFHNGFTMGIEEATKKYGVNADLFKIDYQDSEGDPRKSVMAFQKQKIDGFDVYASVSTVPVNAFGEEVDKLNKPHFIAAFDPFITEVGDNRFRVMANSKIEAPLIVEYVKYKKAKKVHIIQLNLSYAEEEFSKIVQPELESAGIHVSRQLYDMDKKNFKNIILKAKQSNSDLIILNGFSFHIYPLIKELRSIDYIKDGNVLSVMDFVDLIYGDISMEELRGIAFITPDFDMPGKIKGISEWRDRYFQKFKISPTYVPAYAYDNATLLVKAYAENKGIVTSETIKKSLPFEGVNGLIKLDKNRDILSTLSLAKVDNFGNIIEIFTQNK